MTYVPPEGPTNRPILAIVGDAPGREEELARRPFVGSSGRLLDQMLATAGIARGECYVTNVAKIRPPNNNFLQRYYDNGNPKFPSKELFGLHEQLYQELRAISPCVVVAMGAEALKALTPHSAIKNHRGCMVEHHGLRILPTYHPSYILRGMYEERPIVEADLHKAFRQARNPYTPKVNFNVEPTFEECLRFLRQRPEFLSMDIETVGNLTRSVGFATSKLNAISIPLMKGRTHAWTEPEELEILHEMDRLFRSPDVGFMIQNMMYDVTVLAKEFGFYVRRVHMDTMLAHHLLYPELPKGLDFQSSVYTDHPMYWDYDSSSWKSTALYNCFDCAVTFECAEEHEAELRDRGMWRFYQDCIQRSVESLLYIQSRGVRINHEAREVIRRRTETEMVEVKNRIAKQVGYDLNPSSPKQIATLCYDTWKLPKQLHNKTKKPTTDDDALSALAKKFPIHSGVLNGILEYRQKRILVSTFCDMELRDGRVFTSYNVGGTVTGRLASSATYDRLGGNLQNIPRGDFRRIFVADPGKVLIKADLSQAEYRVLIWKARIQRVIDRWTTEPGFNIHMWNAAENIYRIPIEQVTKTQYSNSKNGVYGANYNIGAHKVSRMYNIEFREAKFILERYHEAVPEVQCVYQREIREEVESTRQIINPLGRKRFFFGRMDDELYRAAYSHYCQSTIADLILLGLNDLVELGVDVLLQVHDELVAQCDEADVVEVVGLMKEKMERPMMIEGNPTPLVIPCEIKVGRNWYDTMSLDKWLAQEKSEVKSETHAAV